MKKSVLFIIFAAVVATGLLGQASPVLMTIGDEDITLEEFERIYQKNNNESSLNRQSPEAYLELFINFKIKVKEAEALGMDTTTKFINELEGYRKQLAKPYLIDEEAKEEMMREAYEWSKYDIRASHILIRLPENSSPEDTLAAYKKIMAIRSRIERDEPFEVVARATSEDASVQQNGGDLNYFTVFSMVYPFETAAYNTQVGQLSMPFRTNYGYHIIKVNDRRPARGTIKVAHIFIRTPSEIGEDQKKEAYEKVQMVYDSLQMGTNFGALAMHHSDDRSSARSGGEIPWFGTGRMIPEFENACFTIDKKGDYSKPFKSFYGWHIVKLIDKKEIGTYEEMKPELHQKTDRSDRNSSRSDNFIAKLKSEYDFSENIESLKPLYEAVDSTLKLGIWKAGGLKNLNSQLMKIGEQEVLTGEFAAYMEEKQYHGKARDPLVWVELLYKNFSDEVVMAYEEERLPEKYPEFRYIYEEYHDGILLFDIMDQRVWSMAIADTSGLVAFHKEHKKEYMWEERTDAFIVKCAKGADVAGINSTYKKIARGKLDQEALNAKYCSNDTIPCITLTRHLVEKGENEMIDARNGVTGPGPVIENEEASTIVIVKGVRSPEQKKLEEARGQITSDYQEYLESEWLKTLKEKYPVTVNQELLNRIKS
ncbi:MAG: peptidylprolyl isomerase [Bacteroidales bacterium]|nr:peptidylprolyl isomerase [Bacteroidales bacterium]